MKFKLNKIDLSYTDKKDGIILPKKTSLELAEMLGILAGDGHVKHYSKWGDYNIVVYGHIVDDLNYLEYVQNLMFILFKLKPKLYLKNKDNTAFLLKRSKGILSFLNQVGYNKSNCIISTPDWIWNKEKYTRRFIRGIFDTDGSLSLRKNKNKPHYPVININLKDSVILAKIADWTKKKNIRYYFYNEKQFDKRTKKIYFRSKLQIMGYEHVEKWMRYIGTSNFKQKEKWDKRDLNSRL